MSEGNEKRCWYCNTPADEPKAAVIVAMESPYHGKKRIAINRCRTCRNIHRSVLFTASLSLFVTLCCAVLLLEYTTMGELGITLALFCIGILTATIVRMLSLKLRKSGAIKPYNAVTEHPQVSSALFQGYQFDSEKEWH